VESQGLNSILKLKVYAAYIEPPPVGTPLEYESLQYVQQQYPEAAVRAKSHRRGKTVSAGVCRKSIVLFVCRGRLALACFGLLWLALACFGLPVILRSRRPRSHPAFHFLPSLPPPPLSRRA